MRKNKTNHQNITCADSPTEKSISKSEARYRTILEDIKQGYFETDLAGNLTFFNDTICRTLEYPRQELMGMNNRYFTEKEDLKKVFQAYNKVYKTGEPNRELVWKIITKDGTEKYIESSVLLIKDSSGKPLGFRGVTHDITRRKKIEEELRKSESNYRQLFENSPAAIYQFDYKTGKIIKANDLFCEYLGCSQEEITSLNPYDFLTQGSKKLLLERMEKISQGVKVPEIVEYEVFDKKGKRWILQLHIKDIYDAQGHVFASDVVGHDITERKQIEEALRKSEENFRRSLDDSPLGVRISTIDGETIYANRMIMDIYGYDSIQELKHTPLKERYTPESYAEFQARKKKRLQGDSVPSEYEISIVRKNGEIRHLHVFRKEIFWNGEKQSLVIYQDITKRKQAEESALSAEKALKKSEERYRSVFENAGLPLVIMEDSLVISMANERFIEMSGFGKNEVEGKMKFTDFIASEDRNAFKKCFSRRKGDQQVEYECQIAHRNGKLFDGLIRIGHIPGAAQFIASFTDITSRKQAESALLESREHLQKENIRLRSSIRERYRFCDIIGKSKVMQDVYEFILKAAATQANVIIYGESGTGKELVARERTFRS